MSMYFPSADECNRLTICPGVNLRTCAAEQMMLSVADLEAHAVVPEHRHPHEQVGVVLEGEVTFYIGDEHKTLRAGDLFRIPGNTPHRVVALDRPARVLDIFHPIRDEYR